MRTAVGFLGVAIGLGVACSSEDASLRRGGTLDDNGGTGGVTASPSGGVPSASGFAGSTGGRATGGVIAGGGLASTGGSSGGATPDASHDGSLGRDSGADADDSVVLPACRGATPLPSGVSTCRTQSDCLSGTGCSHDQGGDFQCWFLCEGMTGCAADTDCQPGFVCDIRPPYPGCKCERLRSLCNPSCDMFANCGDAATCLPDGHCAQNSCLGGGFQCPTGTVCGPSLQADPHGCRPALCNAPLDGYACPTGYACEPTRVDADEHGCSPVKCPTFACSSNYDCTTGTGDGHGCAQRHCSSDVDCDCGACISGFCQDRLYGCFLIPPP